MNKVRILLASIILLLLFPLHPDCTASSIKYPRPTESGYVNDYAGVLDSSTEQKIVSIGQELDSKTKAQIVVVTLDRLPEGTTIEEYANGLFRDWGIGDRKLKNGLLLIVNIDPGNRVARIEVGEGLEGKVTDASANRIMEENILPYFKQGDYNSGILNGYYTLSNKVAEEYNVVISGNPGNTGIPPHVRDRGSNLPLILAALFFLLFDGVFFRFRILRFIFYMLAMSRFRGGRGGGGFGGGSGGGFGGFGGGSSSGGGANGRW